MFGFQKIKDLEWLAEENGKTIAKHLKIIESFTSALTDTVFRKRGDDDCGRLVRVLSIRWDYDFSTSAYARSYDLYVGYESISGTRWNNSMWSTAVRLTDFLKNWEPVTKYMDDYELDDLRGKELRRKAATLRREAEQKRDEANMKLAEADRLDPQPEEEAAPKKK